LLVRGKGRLHGRTYQEGGIQQTIENAVLLLRFHPSWSSLTGGGWLRYDEMSACIEFLPRKKARDGRNRRSEGFRPITDDDVTDIICDIAQTKDDFAVSFSHDAMWKAIQSVAKDVVINPPRDMLRFCRQYAWDGAPRLGGAETPGWLTTYGGAEDTPYIRAVSRAFLVSLVARVMQPGCKVDTMLLLIGPQGCGKSTIARILGGQWFTDAVPNLRSATGQDVSLLIRRALVVEMAELASMRQTHVEDLKAFLSRTTEQYRKPYDRAPVTEPRRCVFIGTTNAETPLRDATGGRRFWPVEVATVHPIDLDGLQRDLGMLFGEAVALYDSEVPWWLAPGEEALARVEQQSRQEVDPWRDQIRDWLEKHHKTDAPLSSHTIAQDALALERLGPAQSHRVAACMRALGWAKRHTVAGEPPRVLRRPWCLSHAARAGGSAWA
jgi:predicted P-loop ATPase